MSRCQRGTVSGVTIIRRPAWRARGITPSSATIGARSAQESFGLAMGWRRRTASWWRSSSISAFFQDSSRRHSHDHAASRVISRKTNRRHMTRDHRRWRLDPPQLVNNHGRSIRHAQPRR
jgi:hypothetical protein